MIKLQSIAQPPTEPSQALSTQMSPPQGDSLILHHLPVMPLHSVFSGACLSSWVPKLLDFTSAEPGCMVCMLSMCVYVVYVQVCMLGEEGICLNPEP